MHVGSYVIQEDAVCIGCINVVTHNDIDKSKIEIIIMLEFMY